MSWHEFTWFLWWWPFLWLCSLTVWLTMTNWPLKLIGYCDQLTTQTDQPAHDDDTAIDMTWRPTCATIYPSVTELNTTIDWLNNVAVTATIMLVVVHNRNTIGHHHRHAINDESSRRLKKNQQYLFTQMFCSKDCTEAWTLHNCENYKCIWWS